MSLVEEFRTLASSLLAQFGTSALWQVPTKAYADDGTVTETLLSYSVACTDMVDESRRYAASENSQRATGTLYVAFNGMPAGLTPSIGHRVSFRGRYWIAVSVQPYAVQGADVMWRVDVAQTGAVGG